MKKDRAKIIKRSLDELRKKIEIKNELQLIYLELLKRMENKAIEENSDEAVKRIKEYVKTKKYKIYKFPLLGIKTKRINDKMVISKI